MKVTLEFELSDEYWGDSPDETLLDELIETVFSAGVISTSLIKIER